VQVRAVLGEGCADPIKGAESTILSVFLNGLRPDMRPAHPGRYERLQ
jgi:hypothetical protein